MVAGVEKQLRFHQHQLQSTADRLRLLNPNEVLNRGYAIVKDMEQNVISDSQQLNPHQLIEITFAKGSSKANILK
jgi:exodeoxyribonuclease VII large subunit